MVSEGNDIPRLQVSCYLSAIRTELYFHQVLGRVLRIDQSRNEEGWLYAIAEPKVNEYAQRISDDLPADNMVILNVHLPLNKESELPTETEYSPSVANGEKDTSENFFNTQAPFNSNQYESQENGIEILLENTKYKSLILSIFKLSG